MILRALLLTGVLLFCLLSACSDSGDPNDMTFDDPLLNKDGGNVSAPVLLRGNYEGAVRFTPAAIGSYTGKNLIGVYYFMTARPNVCRIKIYGEGTTTTPGALLYSAEVTASIERGNWNRHNLPQGIALGSSDIWISAEMQLSTDRATLGCDAGPAKTDGDWLYSVADGDWIPLSQRSGVDINWNLRGIVSE